MNYPDIVLKKGIDKPDLVKALKVQLNALGFGPLDSDNPTFGDTTELVVKAFQKSRLLNQDGEVGPLTWHRLFTERKPIIEVATDISGVAVEIALSQLYVREKTGKNDGEEVEKYLKSVGLGKGYAWCVAFLYWCFEQAATKLKVGNPMILTAGVLDLWNRTPKGHRHKEPKKGAIGVLDFGGGKGHVYLVKSLAGDNKIPTIEGNTSADPTTAAEDREGQGVYERLRSLQMPSLKGFIWYD